MHLTALGAAGDAQFVGRGSQGHPYAHPRSLHAPLGRGCSPRTDDMALPLLPLTQTLNSSMEALAALGALLRMRREGLAPDPRVAAALEKVVGVIDPGLLDATTPQEEAIAVGYIRAFFLQ